VVEVLFGQQSCPFSKISLEQGENGYRDEIFPFEIKVRIHSTRAIFKCQNNAKTRKTFRKRDKIWSYSVQSFTGLSPLDWLPHKQHFANEFLKLI
jgi:hypothetical protein